MPFTALTPFKPAILISILAGFWLVLITATWAHWGNLTIDCGREAYVPAQLLNGKTLYRDIWYLYTPGGPYLNRFLFEVFGTNLRTLYLAGSVAALISALATAVATNRICNMPAAYAAGFLILIQSFQHSLFSFPFPYSAGAAYGAALTALALACGVSALLDNSRWMFACAALFSALAWLMKMEMGGACLIMLICLFLFRAIFFPRLTTIALDALVVFFALLIVASTSAWMLKQGGPAFLFQENLMSWPSSYFMRTYGSSYMKMTGWDPSIHTFTVSLGWSTLFFAFWIGMSFIGQWSLMLDASLGVRHLWYFSLFLIFVICLINPDIVVLLRQLLLPRATILITLVCGTFFLRRLCSSWQPIDAARLFACLMAALTGIRIFFGLELSGYSIFYNNIALCTLMLAFDLLMFRGGQLNDVLRPWPYVAVAFLGIAVVASSQLKLEREAHGTAPAYLLSTAFGDNYTSRYKSSVYMQLIQIMKQAQKAGDAVLVMPEDTSLYFLSGTSAPTRVYTFTPGLVAPGKMTDDFIASLKDRRIRYILLSSRSFPEYGAPTFGIDFDQPIWNFVHAHYRRTRTFDASSPDPKWRVEQWEWNH